MTMIENEEQVSYFVVISVNIFTLTQIESPQVWERPPSVNLSNFVCGDVEFLETCALKWQQSSQCIDAESEIPQIGELGDDLPREFLQIANACVNFPKSIFRGKQGREVDLVNGGLVEANSFESDVTENSPWQYSNILVFFHVKRPANSDKFINFSLH